MPSFPHIIDAENKTATFEEGHGSYPGAGTSAVSGNNRYWQGFEVTLGCKQPGSKVTDRYLTLTDSQMNADILKYEWDQNRKRLCPAF